MSTSSSPTVSSINKGKGRAKRPARTSSDGLVIRATGAFDRRTLRFVKDGEHVGDNHETDTAVSPAARLVLNDLYYIGSYSWTNRASPTILVPGAPRIWKPKEVPFDLLPDVELFKHRPMYIDQNAARLPLAPLLPLVHAVDVGAEGTSFPWAAVDVVSDRNNIRKLLRWVEGSGKAKEFRIDTQLAGERTVLLSRWEERVAVGPEGSYGFSFEDSQTFALPGCEEATSYHRIISYDFGGMRLVVRFEVDASFPDEIEVEKKNGSSSLKTPAIDELVALLSGTRLGSSETPSPGMERSTSTEVPTEDVIQDGLTIKRVGTIARQEDLIELATRKKSGSLSWSDTFPHLLLSATPHHILAKHESGTFVSVVHRRLHDATFEHIADAVQPGLKKLRVLLKEIQDLLIARGPEARLSLVCRKGHLEVFERSDRWSVLPSAALKKFESIQ